MAATVIDDPKFRNKSFVFEDRGDAGLRLAKMLEQFRGKNAVVLAIPSGGVPVGLAVSSYLDLPFDLLIIRKIPIPGNTEAGFGAVSLEGDMLLNDSMVKMLRLSDKEIMELAKPVKAELEARDNIFRRGRPMPDLEGKTVILADDGLASGYTMMAAARLVRRRKPAMIVVAVPTASLNTIEVLSDYVDMVVCLNIRSGYSFAVADAYRNWYDLSREEVVSMLRKHNAVNNRF